MQHFLKKPIVKAVLTIVIYSVAVGLSIRLNNLE